MTIFDVGNLNSTARLAAEYHDKKSRLSRFIDKEEDSHAIKILEQFLREGDSFAKQLTVETIVIYLNLGKFETAIKLIEKFSLEVMEFASAEALFQIGVGLRNFNLPLVERFLLRAIQINPSLLSNYIELAEIYYSENNLNMAVSVIKLAKNLVPNEAELEVRCGRLLWKLNQSGSALAAFDRAYNRGVRDESFLVDYAWLLTGEKQFDSVPDIHSGNTRKVSDSTENILQILSSHARLSMFNPVEDILPLAQKREASDQWVPTDHIFDYLSKILERKEPFSWIRLGDGEGRFVACLIDQISRCLSKNERRSVINQIWTNWFGISFDNLPDNDINRIFGDFLQAVNNSDMLGVSAESRFYEDTAHYGYLASLENFLSNHTNVYRRKTVFVDALSTYKLLKYDPFFHKILTGRKFLGVISPHKELANYLKAKHHIDVVQSYTIPGETRLGRPDEATNRGEHYPDFYNKIIDSIQVINRGDLFLVAGGLLGKIYCNIIKHHGGIAFDIGAVADVWMGYNTRPGHLDNNKSLIENN